MSKQAHNKLIKLGNLYVPELTRIVIQNGIISIEVPKNLDVFDCFAQTVVEQQLSYKAAKSIWNKVTDSAKNMNIKLIDYFDEKNFKLIRDNGLSQNKIRSIMGAKEAIKNGSISMNIIQELPYDEYKDLVKSLWGFGDWSAEMIAIFYLGRTNVWSDGDLMLKKGIKEICENSSITPDELVELVDPFQSYLALHIWRHKD
ncbi:MAG TPA: hypothetical protein DCL68_03270 [Gammaproteobacteria bacterium]|nr:hypothetical protein [Gammaproteobacteria bacterium]|tara:strand:+ start:1456 stop:2058 length:603 start_codon:yes stop_codon:yes gene_type:complete